nr:sugar transferase [Fervidobacterium pennivorans]
MAEKYLKRIPIEVIERFESYYMVEFSKLKEKRDFRIMDVVLSSLLLVLYSPVLLIASIWIYLEDGLPIVFKQLRVGKDGKPFEMVKLRSMRKSGQQKHRIDEEHRILKVGKFIRPFRIDEALQFWNILKGDMSLVGPRPMWVVLDDEYSTKLPYYGFRKLVRPGITGWAQIKFAYENGLEDMKIKLSYDLYYVKNKSFWLDLKILLQTPEAVIFRRGAM